MGTENWNICGSLLITDENKYLINLNHKADIYLTIHHSLTIILLYHHIIIFFFGIKRGQQYNEIIWNLMKVHEYLWHVCTNVELKLSFSIILSIDYLAHKLDIEKWNHKFIEYIKQSWIPSASFSRYIFYK